jgi:NAD(P)-dependent dehydrogenase (short-subunit alcohol dehydrogenase family)
VAQLGRLDILVNNAGIAGPGKRVDEHDVDNAALDRQWVINTMGVVANIRATAKVLPDDGRIISIGLGLGTRVLSQKRPITPPARRRSSVIRRGLPATFASATSR